MLQTPFGLKNICWVGWLEHFSSTAACLASSRNNEGGTHMKARKNNCCDWQGSCKGFEEVYGPSYAFPMVESHIENKDATFDEAKGGGVQ